MSYVREKWDEAFDKRIAIEPCLENNKVWIEGVGVQEFRYDHYSHDTDIYIGRVATRRLSGTIDNINVMVTNKLLGTMSLDNIVGKEIQIAGKLVSRRIYGEDRIYNTILYVFAQQINLEPIKHSPNDNIVYISGMILTKPKCREISKGKKITDILLRIPKGYGRFAYAYCIAWGGYAKYASTLKEGTEVEVYGRIQSRWLKRKGVVREYYEVTIYSIEKNKSK